MALGPQLARMLTPSSLLPIALEAIGIANEIIRTHRPGTLTEKGERDIASEVDFAVERRLREFFAQRTPSIGFLGEEEGPTPGASRAMAWTLDPVDGTVNFVHGIPLCAVALALIDHDQPVFGVIDLPFLGARYWAAQGQGAFLNDRRLQLAGAPQLCDAIVALGDFAVGPEAAQENPLRFEVTNQIASQALRVRMIGSAAIDMAWLAEGKIDASITLCNRPWDMAAGVVLAREAGARVVDMDGSEYRMGSRAVLACAPALTDQLVSIVRRAERRLRARI
ncbi:MAG: inositol monophosphatase family protein [Actinomycetota bacterium]